MKIIKGECIEIKSVNDIYYQVGIDDWNIVVGLGGLIYLKDLCEKIITERLKELDKELGL